MNHIINGGPPQPQPQRPPPGGPYLLLELHADGVGLLQVHGVPPQLVTQGGELVVPPLPEAPLGQVKLMLG